MSTFIRFFKDFFIKHVNNFAVDMYDILKVFQYIPTTCSRFSSENIDVHFIHEYEAVS